MISSGSQTPTHLKGMYRAPLQNSAPLLHCLMADAWFDMVTLDSCSCSRVSHYIGSGFLCKKIVNVYIEHHTIMIWHLRVSQQPLINTILAPWSVPQTQSFSAWPNHFCVWPIQKLISTVVTTEQSSSLFIQSKGWTFFLCKQNKNSSSTWHKNVAFQLLFICIVWYIEQNLKCKMY